MTTPSLLPCPFCGGTASLDDSVGGAFVSCDLCEAQGPFVKYEGFPDPPTHDEFLQLVFQAKQKAEVTAAAAWNQRSAWQPIETAPKGEEVLVFMPPLPYEDDDIVGKTTVAMQSSFFGWWMDEKRDDLVVDPTHWQPLPSPPPITP